MFLVGKEDCDTLGIFPCESKIRTVGDHSRCLVGVWVREMSYYEQGEVSSVVLPGRHMDEYGRGTVGVNVEIIVSDAPYQDTAGYFGGSPTD